MQTRPILITPGCPAGIGPEVIARALVALDDDGTLADAPPVVFVGGRALLAEGARRAGVRVPDVPCALDDDTAYVAGTVDDAALALQKRALLHALDEAAAGRAAGVVTGPIRKAVLDDVDGVAYPGHTELFHARLKVDDAPPLMCFTGGPFVLGLATVHVPIAEVSRRLTRDLVEARLFRLIEATRALTETSGPLRVVVLGLNPHAGEGGRLGNEERDTIAPAIDRVRTRASGAGLDVDIQGPTPADGFFASWHRLSDEERPHAVLAMTHDQGLAPYKLLSGGAGVNVTWGLRVPRTSPDHGTADAIAGRGVADATSMMAAIRALLRALPAA